MVLALPSARPAIRRGLGRFMDAGQRNGIEISTRGDLVVVDIWRDGAKFYTVEMPHDRASQVAELLDMGARHIRRAGGSVSLPAAALRPRA